MAAKRRYVAFTADKHGRPLAYITYQATMRWFRIGLDEAKVLVATGAAEQVPYCPNRPHAH